MYEFALPWRQWLELTILVTINARKNVSDRKPQH